MFITTANKTQVFQNVLDLLVIPISGKKLPNLPLQKGDSFLADIQRHARLPELEKSGACVFFYPERGGRIALISFAKKPALNEVRGCFDQTSKQAKDVKSLGIVLPEDADEAFVIQAVLSITSGWYDPKLTNSQAKDKKTITIFGSKKTTKFADKAAMIAQSIETVKRLSNTPANLMTPTLLESEAKDLAKAYSLTFRSLDETEMRKYSMGGILGVSQGSEEEAKLIIVEYSPASSAGRPKAKKTVALIGKGITFDSGGISLKHSKSLADMKHDMTGGACVLALVTAAARLKLPYRVVGIIAATENLPSGKALKPGDVITTTSGKTVEVLNTDAEGRLVLADALTYVQKKYQPKLIVDIATLTSSIIISLGSDITGAFGNNKEINDQLLQASKASGENFHFMPLHKKYQKDLPSKLADLKNMGTQRSDAIFAALFLQEFIENNTPWLHLDIAGTAWDAKGATGASVATLIKLFEKLRI